MKRDDLSSIVTPELEDAYNTACRALRVIKTVDADGTQINDRAVEQFVHHIGNGITGIKGIIRYNRDLTNEILTEKFSETAYRLDEPLVNLEEALPSLELEEKKIENVRQGIAQLRSFQERLRAASQTMRVKKRREL